jgi:glycopeptide antibiotics resistance protein
MLGIAFINWLVPMLHSFFRYMLDYGTKTDEFPEFYRYSSILFLLFYIIVLIYGNFAKDAFPWAYREAVSTANLNPFHIISARIESCIYGQLPLNDIITYLASRILTYLPYGFFIALVLRGQNRVVRFFSLLFVPFLIEVLQYFMIPGRCDIDDLIYALLGGLLGSFLFFLTNVLFRTVSGRDFLMKDTVYRNSLHF